MTPGHSSDVNALLLLKTMLGDTPRLHLRNAIVQTVFIIILYQLFLKSIAMSTPDRKNQDFSLKTIHTHNQTIGGDY